jgi:hypothetical protein
LAAAVHVSVLANRATKAHERKLLAEAKECAEQIERLLGNFRQEAAKPVKADRAVRKAA